MRATPWVKCFISLAFSLAACSPGQSPSPPTPAPPPRPPWDRTLPPSETSLTAQAARGLRVARGIIHLHSVHSWDACDSNPMPSGKPDETCATHLRQGLCLTRQDFALLTDHANFMANADWPDLFVQRPGDQSLSDAGDLVQSTMTCADSGVPGRSVLIAPGGENALMPVGLRHHLADTPDARNAAMTADDGNAVAAFMAAGGVVLQAHGESRDLSLLRTLANAGLGGMEVYNLHANIDPKIRSEYLGLDGLGAVAGLWPWINAAEGTDPQSGPEPDLALLGFLEENLNQLGKYDALLGDGHHLVAVAGSDIHENAFKETLADGERGDSYRRLMRWFSNHVLVSKDAPLSIAAIKAALAQGRSYAAFEVFGTPVGFDYHADTPAGPAEMGDTVKPGATLRLHAPRPDTLGQAAPSLRLRILRIAPGAATSVEAAALDLPSGATPTDELRFVATQPGAYRAEVHIVPNHLVPLLGDKAETYRRPYPYVYTSPIYVSAP